VCPGSTDLAEHDTVGEARKALTAEILARKRLNLTFGRVEELILEFRL
jgi:hypothetical protein